MAHPSEPYSPRYISYVDTLVDADFAIKIYGIRHQEEFTGPILTEAVAASVHAAIRSVLDEHARHDRSYGLGFCIVHIGEEAVWLLVDWWISGGIVQQKMLSAPLERPDAFMPVIEPALACVWELVVMAHERNAWVKHMLTAQPDAGGYLRDVLHAGKY